MPKWVEVKLSGRKYSLLSTTEGGRALNDKGLGIELVSEGLPFDVWKIDLDVWPHLAKGILDKLKVDSHAKPAVSMKWSTNLPNMPLLTQTKKSRIVSYNLLGSRIITLDSKDIKGGISIQSAAKKIYQRWPGSFELSQVDPRHIGTHSHANLHTMHKHIVKKDGGVWTGPDLQEMEKILNKVHAVTL